MYKTHRLTHTYTHSDTRIYIYIYICMYIGVGGGVCEVQGIHVFQGFNPPYTYTHIYAYIRIHTHIYYICVSMRIYVQMYMGGVKTLEAPGSGD